MNVINLLQLMDCIDYDYDENNNNNNNNNNNKYCTSFGVVRILKQLLEK
jgi:hypothetical protein